MGKKFLYGHMFALYDGYNRCKLMPVKNTQRAVKKSHEKYKPDNFLKFCRKPIMLSKALRGSILSIQTAVHITVQK